MITNFEQIYLSNRCDPNEFYFLDQRGTDSNGKGWVTLARALELDRTTGYSLVSCS